MGATLAKTFKRFITSGAINGASSEAKIYGVSVTALGADATVSFYDAQGATLAQKFASFHFQPGTSNYLQMYYYCRDGGYVEITGSAEVFVHML